MMLQEQHSSLNVVEHIHHHHQLSLSPTTTTTTTEVSYKDVLKIKIKEWVQLDSEIKEIERGLKERKEMRKHVTKSLVNIMSMHQIDCCDIQNDSQIIYNRKEIKKPLTKRKMQEIICNYFNGDVEQIQDLENYILTHRETVVKESILKESKKRTCINNNNKKKLHHHVTTTSTTAPPDDDNDDNT